MQEISAFQEAKSPDTPKRAIPSNVDEDKLTTLVGFSSSNIFDVSCLVCVWVRVPKRPYCDTAPELAPCSKKEGCEDGEEERENRWVEMVFWLEWASFKPAVPLYSHYYVDLSSRVTIEVPLDFALWRQSLVQLKCPSCIFSWRYYLSFKRILGENPEFKRHQQCLAIFSFSFIFVYLTG